MTDALKSSEDLSVAFMRFVSSMSNEDTEARQVSRKLVRRRDAR